MFHFDRDPILSITHKMQTNDIFFLHCFGVMMYFNMSRSSILYHVCISLKYFLSYYWPAEAPGQEKKQVCQWHWRQDRDDRAGGLNRTELADRTRNGNGRVLWEEDKTGDRAPLPGWHPSLGGVNWSGHGWHLPGFLGLRKGLDFERLNLKRRLEPGLRDVWKPCSWILDKQEQGSVMDRNRAPTCSTNRNRVPRRGMYRNRVLRCGINRNRALRCGMNRNSIPRHRMNRNRAPGHGMNRNWKKTCCNLWLGFWTFCHKVARNTIFLKQ